MKQREFDCDVAVVGSGFGGAVSALRLAEAGRSVIVLEQGRRHTPADLMEARRDPRRYLWAPSLGLRGFFWQRLLRHAGIIGASGVGGGSIVWAGVLLEPGPAFFKDPAWSELADWQGELEPHFDTAARMLGRTPAPEHGEMDEHLRRTAAAMGAGDTFGPTPMAIHFGQPGVTEPDPFFDGEGPDRTGCLRCGGCLLGCPYGSKNTLDLNYLWLAERRGVRVLAEHRVDALVPLPGGGYELRVAGRAPLRAREVVLAAGVLGTIELLLRCRDELKTLPHVSPMLGQRVRTNSEAITAVLADDRHADLTHGPTISSEFYPDAETHVTQNRYVGGWHMRFLLGPMVDDPDPRRRARRTLATIARHPIRQLRTTFAPGYVRRLTAMTVMQSSANELQLRLRRSRVFPWKRKLQTALAAGATPPPSYLPQANATARAFAESIGGQPLNMLVESVGARALTAHVLGGAVIGGSPQEGVIDVDHEVFGHPGLFVVDGSAVPANIGVNPSLTITAMAERFGARHAGRNS